MSRWNLKPAGRPVPVYVFNEHNEAFFFWCKARHDGLIERPLDLLHIDAHDDMGRKDTFARSLYFPSGADRSGYLQYYREFIDDGLDIASFILPAVLNRLVRNVYFVFPSWRKFKTGRRRMNICSAFGEGRILKYNLILKGDTDPRVLKAYPDLTRFTYFLMPADRIPRNRKVILDIDLDYFACRDSIHNQFSYQLEVTGDQFAAADSFLRDPTIRFSGLEFKFREKDGRYFTEVSPRKGKDISHLPPKEDLVAEIRSLVSTLSARKVRPAVVTVSRSCVSGYCPPEYAAFIEDELKNALKELVPATDAGAAPPAQENVPAGQNINK